MSWFRSWCVAFTSLLCGAGCKASVSPTAVLYANGFTVTKPQRVGVGSTFELLTAWHDTCSSPGTSTIYGESGDARHAPCDAIKHRVHVRCAKPCRFTAADGRTADNEITWGPTTRSTTFKIETRAETLDVEVSFDAGRDRRLVKLAPLQLVVPTAFTVECGSTRRSFGGCDGEVPVDEDLMLRVVLPEGIMIGSARFNGRSSPTGYMRLSELVPLEPDASGRLRLRPGPVTVVIEVNPEPQAIRRSITLQVGPRIAASSPP